MFQAVPAEVRFPDLDLPEAISELEVAQELQEMAEANVDTAALCLLPGGGRLQSLHPSAVDHMLRRGEFYTAYTPYQPRSPRAHCRRSSSTRA